MEELYLNIFLQGQLSQTQKITTIKLLYKKNDPTNIKNWRPVSLLNTEYKILSKVLSNRLSPLMEDIIDPDQTCGTPGRKLIHSLNILNDIWDITNYPIEARGKLLFYQ